MLNKSVITHPYALFFCMDEDIRFQVIIIASIGQFQSKAEVHMNSGTGTNDGIFKINFDDGNKIRFCSAGG